jgi:hypothetical protein
VSKVFNIWERSERKAVAERASRRVAKFRLGKALHSKAVGIEESVTPGLNKREDTATARSGKPLEGGGLSVCSAGVLVEGMRGTENQPGGVKFVTFFRGPTGKVNIGSGL